MTTGIEVDPNLRRDRMIAARLPFSWEPFFGRFGRLRPVQRETVEPILEGRSVLVCAPTAGGKTEAACAPLVERLKGGLPPWTILYVSPTRALVNDLYERLRRPLEQMRLRVSRRTGDHRDPTEPIPHVIVTTPESFDSMLCREARPNTGHLLAGVSAVVLDEVHLLHGTARGEHVRWLLTRLQRLRSYAREMGWIRHDALQIVGLSATVSNPDSVIGTYLAGGELIAIEGRREIEVEPTDVAFPRVEEMLRRYIASRDRGEKILVFSNRRLRVDELTASMMPTLEPYGYVVRAHHGSLSRARREDTEQAVRTEERIVIFSTSTLEIGVDVGDIDLVVLDGPAPDVPALLQRIGRGNRRTDRTRVLACVSSRSEVIVQAAMIQAARESYFGPAECGPHFAVARQQVASYIYQAPRRARRRDTVLSFLSAQLPEPDAALLLDQMIGTGELYGDAEGVRLGETWIEKASRGDIHSNIEGQAGYTVRDQSTGEAIASGVRFGGGTRMHIGGSTLDVVARGERTLEVRLATGEHAAAASWSFVSGSWVQGAGQPQAVRRYIGLAEEEWPVIRHGSESVAFHFGGGRRKALLRLMAARAGTASAVRINDWVLRFPTGQATKPAWLTDVGAGTLDLLIGEHIDSLERALARPFANKQLPARLRQAEVRGWLRVSEQLDDFQAARFVTPNPSVAAQLECLLDDVG